MSIKKEFINISKNQSFTNPTTYPTLTMDAETTKVMEIWVQSIASGKTVLVQASNTADADWRDIEELVTTALNGAYTAHKGYLSAYRYVKVTLEESGGTGVAIIEITAR
jgi:hypothetical protein